MFNMNRISRYFLPLKAVQIPQTASAGKKPGEMMSKSHRLMLNLGMIQPASNGCYTLLPFAQRSVDKLIKILNEEFAELGALKISMPCLAESSLWKKTGRYEDNAGELFHINSRSEKKLVLNPTHEESIAHLLATVPPVSYKQLPLLLYQISPKFRDEIKPRFGLIRSKEFVMADLYSFDESFESATETYNNLRTGIKRILQKLGVSSIEVAGDSGMMGGTLSHEIHVLSEIGDDSLQVCTTCDYSLNKNVIGETFTCNNCKLNNLKEHKGIEVAHSFLLGKQYSEALSANFRNTENKLSPFVMGSYGIGVSRLVGAVTEALSSEDYLKWPLPLVPFSTCIISPKAHKIEEETNLTEKLYHALSDIESLNGDIIIDDRTNLSIGRRLIETKRIGFPFIVILGKSAFEDVPKFEIHDVYKDECIYLELPEVLKYFTEKFSVDIPPKSVYVSQFV